MFKSLEDKMKYYRSLSDYKLLPKSPVMLMLDGRRFSKFCKQFNKPYDDNFIEMMNKTALYLCNNIENVMFAYVQSDEISIYLSDEGDSSDSWFSYRISKLCSIASSMAASYFNKLMTLYLLNGKTDVSEIRSIIDSYKTVEFDCKAWNLPDIRHVYLHFLWRQIDCVRNSKQMFARGYFSHNELEGVNTDDSIKMVKEKIGADWNDIEDGKKYGRFIYKLENIINTDNVSVVRYKNFYSDGFDLTSKENKEKFFSIIRHLKELKNDKISNR